MFSHWSRAFALCCTTLSTLTASAADSAEPATPASRPSLLAGLLGDCTLPGCAQPHAVPGCPSLLPGPLQGICLHAQTCRDFTKLSDDEIKSMLIDVCYDRKNPPPREKIDLIERLTEAALTQFQTRYNTTTAWHSTVGAPQTLTYSIVPDGLLIPAGVNVAGDAAGNSNLVTKLDQDFFIFGGRNVWVGMIDYCMNRWGKMTGLSYQRVTDDGAAWDSPGAPGLRGDVRIGGRRIDGGGGVLAFNYFPVSGGDMVIDTSEFSWATPLLTSPSFSYFQNVFYHEHGHGMGLRHVCPVTNSKLMEPYATTAFYGPQHDDVSAAQRLYGDAFENNDTAATATDGGSLSPNQTRVPSDVNSQVTEYAAPNVTLTSIDDSGDVDFFRFGLTAASAVNIVIQPIGYNYDSSTQSGETCNSGSFINSSLHARLAVDLLSSDGSTVLATNSATAVGSAARLTGVTVPGGNFYVRIRPIGAVASNQMYAFTISAGPLTPPANDNCFNAVVMQTGQLYLQNNFGATSSNYTAPCVPQTFKDVWFYIVPACSGTIRFDSSASNNDHIVTVYTGVCTAPPFEPGLTPIACGQSSILDVPVSPATVYFVRIAGYSNSLPGEMSIGLRATYLPPANDTCAGAIALSDGSVVNANNCGALNDGDGTCTGGSTGDVWYTYTAPASELLTLNACSSMFDPVLTVFTGTCTTLSQLTCNDDSTQAIPGCTSPSAAALTIPTTAGQTYRIRLASVTGTTGNFTLTASSRVGNDLCADAYSISSGSYTGSTLNSTRDLNPTCLPSGTSGDVFYRWVAPCSGTLTITTCGPVTDFDTVLAVYSGACSALTELACNDDSACGPVTTTSTISTPVVSGQPYTIRVGGFNAEAGAFNLNVSSTPVIPANDSCATPSIIVGTGTYTGSTECATPDAPNASCAVGLARDVWYAFTPQCAGTVAFSTCGSSYDTVLRVYTGDCGALTEVICNDDSCDTQSSLSFSAAANITYRICVSGYNTDRLGAYTLSVIFPPNNPCTAPAPLALEGSTPFDTTCAGPSGSASCGQSNDSPALWYTFIAACSGEQRLSTCGSSFDTVLSAYAGDCNTLSELACNDDAACATGSLQSAIAFQALAGTPLRIRISGFNGLRGPGSISHTCTRPCPADFNSSGAVTVQDIFDFLSAYFANIPAADFNSSSAITVQDIFDFLSAYFAGCP